MLNSSDKVLINESFCPLAPAKIDLILKSVLDWSIVFTWIFNNKVSVNTYLEKDTLLHYY